MAKGIKSTFLFLSLLFLSLGIESCGSGKFTNNQIKFEKNPPFTVGTVYFQKWVSGLKDGNSGLEVHLVFTAINPKTTITDIYFRNEVLKPQNLLNNQNEYVAHLSNDNKKDIIMDIDSVKEAANTPSQKFPFDLKENEAVVSYFFEDRINYFKLSNVQEKEQIAYPQSNSNYSH